MSQTSHRSRHRTELWSLKEECSSFRAGESAAVYKKVHESGCISSQTPYTSQKCIKFESHRAKTACLRLTVSKYQLDWKKKSGTLNPRLLILSKHFEPDMTDVEKNVALFKSVHNRHNIPPVYFLQQMFYFFFPLYIFFYSFLSSNESSKSRLSHQIHYYKFRRVKLNTVDGIIGISEDL